MGGVAALAQAAGHRVTGCDRSVYPPMSTQLAALGIELIEGYDPGQLDLAPDVVLVGNVMSRGNALIERLLAYLRAKPKVRIIGPQEAGAARVGTVSFVHEGKSSRELAAALDRTGIAIRHGHMYAWHLCKALGLDLEDGVLRVSFVHYNTLAEIERLIEVLDTFL